MFIYYQFYSLMSSFYKSYIEYKTFYKMVKLAQLVSTYFATAKCLTLKADNAESSSDNTIFHSIWDHLFGITQNMPDTTANTQQDNIEAETKQEMKKIECQNDASAHLKNLHN